MRVRALTISSIVFFLTVASQDICLAHGTQQDTQPRFSLTLSAAKTTVKAGAELRLQIIQKNVTDQVQPFWVWKNYKLNGEYLFRVHLSRADGSEAPRSQYFRELVDNSGNFNGGGPMSGGIITKKPGESIVSSLDLSQLYELKPGKYIVHVDQKDSIGKMTVKSNTIEVTITP